MATRSQQKLFSLIQSPDEPPKLLHPQAGAD